MRDTSSAALVLQKLRMMSASRVKVRILLIRSWTEELAPLRAELRAVGFDAHIVRVDFEPALNAAIARKKFDAIVFDPATPGITRAMLDSLRREHRISRPVVEVARVELLGAALKRGLAARLN